MASVLHRSPPLAGAGPSPAYRAPALWLLSVVVLLLALVALPPLANEWADDIRARSTEAQSFSDTLAGLESDLQQMQSAARGYLITQTPAFQEQYRVLQDGLPLRLQDLTRLAPQVSLALEAQVSDLSEAVARWQREGSDRQLELAAQGRPSDAVAELATGSSQAIFDAIRTRIGEIRQRTLVVRGELSTQLAQARSAQLALTVGLGMAGLVAAGFVVVGFQRLSRLTRENAQLFTAAHTEHQRLQTIFDHSPAGIVVVDAPHAHVAMVNPAAEALLGDLKPAAARGAPVCRPDLPARRPALPARRSATDAHPQRWRQPAQPRVCGRAAWWRAGAGAAHQRAAPQRGRRSRRRGRRHPGLAPPARGGAHEVRLRRPGEPRAAYTAGGDQGRRRDAAAPQPPP